MSERPDTSAKNSGPSPISPDLLLGGAVIALALVLRMALLFRAPPFIEWHDSASYAVPALYLVEGEGFPLELKRAPFYSFFLAAAFWLFGEDLRAPLLLQHLLGAVSAGLTYALGRMIWGRPAGLLAGLVTALNGGLMFVEHMIMSETLFGFFLLVVMVCCAAIRSSHPIAWALAAGAMVGLTALTRPSMLMVLPMLALVGSWLAPAPTRRRALVGGLIVLGCFAVAGPWMARNYFVNGVFTIAGGTGEALIHRTHNIDKGFVHVDDPPANDTDPRLAAARRYLYRELRRTDEAYLLYVRLQREFNLTEAEADRLMNQVAVRAIQRDPWRFVSTSLSGTVELFLGWDRPLGRYWDQAGKPKIHEQWGRWAASLLGPPTAAQQRELPTVQALLDLFEHYRYSAVLVPLFVVGSAAALTTARWRTALPCVLAVVIILTFQVTMSAPVTRYRVPLEPLIAVLSAGGLVAIWELARWAWQQRGRLSLSRGLSAARGLALSPHTRASR